MFLFLMDGLSSASVICDRRLLSFLMDGLPTGSVTGIESNVVLRVEWLISFFLMDGRREQGPPAFLTWRMKRIPVNSPP